MRIADFGKTDIVHCASRKLATVRVAIKQRSIKMKSVLISIQPKWVEKIANGEKTIEVRKTAPKEVPFKAYIYCTKEKKQDDIIWAGVCGDRGKWNEHIIGEFICDKVEMVNAKCSDYGIDLFYHDCLTNGCLTEREIEKYFNIPEDRDLRAMKGNGYVWHISDLKIYDKPRELSEFCIPCKVSCENCKNPLYFECWCEEKGKKIVTRPPQSWMYVEDLGEEE